MTLVLDASAVIAFLKREPGAARVAEAMVGGAISSVNHAEVGTKAVNDGMDDRAVEVLLRGLPLVVHPFDAAQAADAALLRRATARSGLSLGDRACLALARALGASVLTADRPWADLDVGVRIELIR